MRRMGGRSGRWPRRWNERWPAEDGGARTSDQVISCWETWPQSGREPSVLAGDAAADLRAGRDAGVRAVACPWGTGRPEALARQAPWRTVTGVAELTILLDGLTASAGAGGQSSSPLQRWVPGIHPRG